VDKLLTEPKKVWGRNDGTDHAYHRAKFGGNRMMYASMSRQSVIFSLCFYYRQDLLQATLPLLFLLTGRFLDSCCTDQGEIWQGGADHPAKFHLDWLRGVDLRLQKLKKFGILPI